MIERCRESFPVTMMCQTLKVSTSGYYQWRSGGPSARQQDNARLLRKIRRVHKESDGVFGGPRVWEELRYDGEPCGLNRVLNVRTPISLNMKGRGVFFLFIHTPVQMRSRSHT